MQKSSLSWASSRAISRSRVQGFCTFVVILAKGRLHCLTRLYLKSLATLIVLLVALTSDFLSWSTMRCDTTQTTPTFWEFWKMTLFSSDVQLKKSQSSFLNGNRSARIRKRTKVTRFKKSRDWSTTWPKLALTSCCVSMRLTHLAKSNLPRNFSSTCSRQS